MASPAPVRSISVLMPTWQGEEFLERVLASLARQDPGVPWDFLAIDSGSTDRTLAILASWRERLGVPLRVRGIDAVEFDHGDTRNLLAAWSAGDLLVFLTQDAIPAADDWLATLARNFEDPAVGAAYCRNVARPDAELLTRAFSEGDPGYATGRREVRLPDPGEYARMDAHQKRLLYNFNDVASAVRRELWERHPFPRTQFGEDVLMARAALEAGWTVVYDDAARVEHSHDYSPDQMRARAEIDGRFNVEWLDRVCVGSKADARTLAKRQLERDREALAAAGVAGPELERELERAGALRRAAFEGLWEGGRSERRFPATRSLERTTLTVLFVVHGFPPDTWAGTEIYTLNLAQELTRRGHRCAVLARAPGGEGDPDDFEVVERDFEGLPVYAMIHRLAHRSLRESYDQPKAERAFREVLAKVRPDVVHFQHLIHTSAGLVELARRMGLATVITCHDYWAVCSRVQLIRPDGVRCDNNMGAGCFLCVKERHLEHIPRVAKLDSKMPLLFDAVAAGRRRMKDVRAEDFAHMRQRPEFVLGAYAAADLRISPGRFLRSKLLESGAFDPHTFLYSDNGMRTDHVRALEKRPDPEGRVRFGFVGSLVWYKGGATMVEAMNRLAGTRAVLNVHGDFRPDEDPHHAELQRLAAAGNVRFLGRFDNSKLSEVYAEIDVLIVPSVWFENSPITIHEAFLTRTPVVASDIGGMAEYVRDGVDGLHFETGNADDLARVMRRFVDEPDLVERLSQDFMVVKTIDENAREMEFRYRGLVCRDRGDLRRTWIERTGVETAAREGGAEQQGADLLLLRPGAAAEYDVAGAAGGEREVSIELFALAPEAGLELAGEVSLDGRPVGSIGPLASEGRDVRACWPLVLELPPDARRLRIEAGDRHLRIAALSVRDPAPDGAPLATAGGPA